ncbi:hypothetical protein PYCC9005_002189 [Savitreella phatthalungensis]
MKRQAPDGLPRRCSVWLARCAISRMAVAAATIAFLLWTMAALWLDARAVPTSSQCPRETRPNLPSSYTRLMQLHYPVDLPTESCTVASILSTFGNAWDTPQHFNATPSECMSHGRHNWRSAMGKLTIDARGRQFDRLGHVLVDGLEVWRFSTLEPSRNGTFQVVSKDLTPVLATLKSANTITVLLNNVVNHIYTAPFNLHLEIVLATNPPALRPPAHEVIPLSGGWRPFTLPGVASTNVSLDAKVTHAEVRFFASGSGREEAWYTGIPSFLDGVLSGDDSDVSTGGAVRAVDVMIDSHVAGFAFIFPVIYTGGANPFLWRPTVATDAYDQDTYTVDLTPWLGILTDGSSHEVRFVMDGGPGEEVRGEWFVSGGLHIWRNDVEASRPSEPPTVIEDLMIVDVTSAVDGRNVRPGDTIPRGSVEEVRVGTIARRSLILETAAGRWTHRASVINNNMISDGGTSNILYQKISGRSHSLDSLAPTSEYRYEMSLETAWVEDDVVDGVEVSSLWGSIDHAKWRKDGHNRDDSVLSVVYARQNGSAVFYAVPVSSEQHDGGWVASQSQLAQAAFEVDGVRPPPGRGDLDSSYRYSSGRRQYTRQTRVRASVLVHDSEDTSHWCHVT